MTSHIDVVLETVDLVSGPDGEHWPKHTHPVHELLSGITRGVSVVTPDAVFIAPPGTSIWIPAGIEHDVRTAAGNRMRCSWFEPIADHALADRVVVATLPPLLNDVLTHLATLEDSEQSRRAEAFAMDLLMGAQTTVHELPAPRSGWLRRVTDAMVADPTDRRSIAEWAGFASVSVRTLARQFQAETGRSLSQWRSELRMRLAMTLLADGVGVGPAARAVGFDSLPAFSAAFRRFAGVSPREFARSTGALADLQQ